jgi:malate dehydrogenase (oxaloacetate-decarboxylating)
VLPSFNDDIQGTPAMALGAVLAAERVTHTPRSASGSSSWAAAPRGIGIAELLRESLKDAGLQGDDLVRAIAVVDRDGLIVDDSPIADPDQRAFAWPAAMAASAGIGTGKARQLEAVVRALKPTVLIGATGVAGPSPAGRSRPWPRRRAGR